jgi:hypothetical protein
MTTKYQTIQAEELTTTERLIIEGAEYHLIEISSNDDSKLMTITWDNNGEECTMVRSYGEPIEIAIRDCDHISGRTYEYPGDYCEDPAAIGSYQCEHHNEIGFYKD